MNLRRVFDRIRNSEQNIPNFLADIMRLETDSDCALLNTGTIRSNVVFPRGMFKMGDIRLILPYADLVMKLELTGAQLLTALENGISKYPALEGRFPAVAIYYVTRLNFKSYLESALLLIQRGNQ